MSNYASFPSIERLENIYCIISEKIDGTNALIEIDIADEYNNNLTQDNIIIRFGSRNSYLTLVDDNAGFANFFSCCEAKLKEVASGIVMQKNEASENSFAGGKENYPIRIYGEWFGYGIQREYNLKDNFFMPFSSFYADKLVAYQVPNIIAPAILYSGKFSMLEIDRCMENLAKEGSKVIENYNRPEGIVIHFPKYNFRVKKTFEGSKWKQSLSK